MVKDTINPPKYRSGEIDPDGINSHEAGAKLDFGKVDMHLLIDFHSALKAVAEVAEYGSRKYTEKGWLEVRDGEKRYTSAMLRHLLTDDELDTDTDLLHDAHLAWNALARLELKIRRISGERKES